MRRCLEARDRPSLRVNGLLQYGPMTAGVFATKMWPDRGYTNGRASQAGHLLLRTLGERGYVDHVGELWTIRRFSSSSPEPSQLPSPDRLQVPSPDHLSAPLREHFQDRLPDAPSEEQADGRRLRQLVGLSDEPVAGVTHDVALGDLRIRGIRADDCLAEACTFAVLRGKSLNVYLPVGAMLTSLSPAEAARTLYLRWRQSGQPPELPHLGGAAWLLLDDGVVAARGAWKPVGAGRDWAALEEPIVDRIQRQRAAAGLGPAVSVGGRR